MTKAAKEQGKDRLALLEKSLDLSEKCIQAGKTEDGRGLLETAQETAIEFGEMIEASEGEGTAAVKQLEIFCEELYQYHESLKEDHRLAMRKALEEAKKRFETEIKIREEAVFLPYKASMWDALESEWKKESAKEGVEAFVIPIPYFDKNPDGTFRKEHYEADQYPPDVPIVSYESYDIEKRRPDRIYIHNPYDEANYVTSVHPLFYSKRLKDLTGELIYIPYFVLDDPVSTDIALVKGMAHFVLVPGVVHAHHTIVQSEQMRKAYINILTDWAGEETRGVWEQKILGTGSPKFERVERISRENVTVPGDWEQKIGTDPETRKKVVFYNTCVSSLLEYGDKMLDKIERVLKLFEEEKDRVVLLWRPHPLIEATVSSMRPELFERYKGIVKTYREKDIGIYDDTADLDRAIAISDAYYGDPSSVVQLVRRVHMPVMIQNVDVE